MIDITIKTLDSSNHVFSVEDEFTVKQLKEHIAEPVNIPADLQRLIYCGRVLVDEKKLSEYDVHGKVIHLVQRPPPSPISNPDSSTSSNNDSRENALRRGNLPPRRGMLTPGRVAAAMESGGNAMYLGAMAFPADLMDAQGISMPQPRHRLSQSRLSVARTMLRRVRSVLINLENPTRLDSSQEMTANNFSDPLQAAFSAAVAHFGERNNVGVQHPPPHINVEDATNGENEMQAEETEPTPEGNSPEESPSGEEAASIATGEDADNTRNGRYRIPAPVHMGDIMNMFLDSHRRITPFLERFTELVSSDPVLENPAESQRLFDLVSKMMHFFAHAFHAISDIMCDFSQPPPRRLRCRPVLIQHSAVLQTGIPIQQVNMGTNSSSRSSTGDTNTQTSQTACNSCPPTSTIEGPQSEVTSTSGTSTESCSTEGTEVHRTSSVFSPIVSRFFSNHSRESNNSSSSSSPGRPLDTLRQGIEFVMDVGQGSFTIDSMEATLVTNSAQGATEATASGTFPWGSTPPPEFLQNLVQALAGHMMGGSSVTSGANSVGQTPQPTTGEANVTNSQARGNTSTQPTTATQTRSTTRPHVHLSPGFQGMGVPGFFDPFLPCNSHHIHGSRRRAETTTVEPSNTSNSQTQRQAQSPQSQSTSQSTGTSTETPSRPTDSPPINLFSNFLSGFRSGQSQVIRILPRDVTVFLQGTPLNFSQNMTSMPAHTTVAELLQSLPDYSYTEGSSIVHDFTMTIARNLRVVDMMNVTNPNSSILTTLRPALREFIRNRLLQGNEDSNAVTDAVNRLNNELRPLIDSICAEEGVLFRDDVDIVATVNQLNHTTVPILIRDIMEEEDSNYLRNIPDHFNEYVRHLASIFLYCCRNGQAGLEAIYTSLARRIIVGVPSALQNWSVVHIVSQLRAMTNNLDLSSASVQPFLVFRMADTEASVESSRDLSQEIDMETEAVTPTAPTVHTQPSGPNQQTSVPVIPLISPISVTPISVSPPISVLQIQPQPNAEQIPDQLPDVILGAEQWHNAVPHDWVPIISRDRDRQRRQAAQGPLSDAYLSGMPSKRRKVVTSAKPHTANLTTVITESMTSALGAAGVPCVDSSVAESAGDDTSLRAAYKEQVRNTLTPTLRQHPDFTPEKYPTAAKLFTPK